MYVTAQIWKNSIYTLKVTFSAQIIWEHYRRSLSKAHNSVMDFDRIMALLEHHQISTLYPVSCICIIH
jgi:hypothetical protein